MRTQFLAICSLSAAISVTLPSAFAAQFKIDGHTFTLPDGFTIERVAGPGLTDRPIHADFDELGRLYVAESSGSNAPVNKQLEEKPHSILRLEDRNGDGKFDRRTVFADRMMFPEGVLWHDGSVYVTAPPQIWKLTDTDDDGVADKREVWYDPGTLTGCANDLHGPFLGRDGWIYWNKGAFAEQKHDLADGGKFTSRAAHIFRRHPSGGGVEPVMTGGMDNPVETVQTPGGDLFFTSTFMRHPGGGMRDGIGYASYGALFGKDHDVVNDHPRTSPALNDPVVHLGPAAATALYFSESDAFGADHRGNLYATLFNLQKVTRHVLIPDGAGYRTTDDDFLVSDNRDFHPTDVFEDADGSLIIVDTGGWYKICCPTSQLYKPDVLGAIYRIRKQGMPTVKDPRGLQLAWKEASPGTLASRLEDTRPFVRQRAISELAAKAEPALAPLKKLLTSSKSSDARVAAVWAVSRIDTRSARELNRGLLGDKDATVRQAALYSAALWRDRAAADQFVNVVRKGSPQHQRLAAEGLGRIRHVAAVPALIEELPKADSVLAQALTRALIDIGDADAIRVASKGALPTGALIALDQLGASESADVLALLNSSSNEDKQTADWIIRRHADWGVALTRYFESRLNSLSQPDDGLAGQIARMSADSAIQSWIAQQLAQTGASESSRITLLKAMSGARLRTVPGTWKDEVTRLLSGAPSSDLSKQALATTATFGLKPDGDDGLRAAIAAIARQKNLPLEIRMAALGALPDPLGAPDSGDLFEFAVQHVDATQPVTVRQIAARVIGSHPLESDRRSRLSGVLGELGPMELNQVLDGVTEPRGDDTDAETIKAVGKAKAFRSIPVDRLRTVFAKYPATLQPNVGELIAQLDESFGEKQERIDSLLAEMKDGDIVRGQGIFNSAKAVCSSCHAIGYLGGDLGPDLTRIGQIRSERDLLEAIVYPSASFVRSYESVRVMTRDGEDFSGVLREDASDHLLLATGPGATTRIARADIQEILPGTLSIMPAGLDEQLSKQELADLLAFLKATRW